MFRSMPLRWIEQAEARRVLALAAVERGPEQSWSTAARNPLERLLARVGLASLRDRGVEHASDGPEQLNGAPWLEQEPKPTQVVLWEPKGVSSNDNRPHAHRVGPVGGLYARA